MIMEKPVTSPEQLIEIEKTAEEIMQKINDFAVKLSREFQFYPDITVKLCANAITNIHNVTTLVYSINPDLRPPYLQTNDFSDALQAVQEQLTWVYPPCTKEHVQE